MKKRELLISVFIFIFLTLVVFRDYFLKAKIPFPANFQVFYYQPWVSQKFPGWEHGIPHKPIGVDNFRIFYPQRIFTNQMIKRGEIPFWNPYNFSGNVHLANSQTAIFYPLFLAFYFLKPIFAWSLMVIIQPFLTALFTYLFLKLITKDNLASLFGSLVFAFSGLMIVRWQDGLVIGHAALWLPLILFSFEKYLLSQEKKWFLLSLFGLLNSLLTGWFQMTFYVWLLAFLYWSWRVFPHHQESLLKKVTMITFPFFISLLLGAFHFAPAIEALLLSPRGLKEPQGLLERFLMPWSHLITFLAPDFWGNPATYNFFGKGVYQEVILYIGLVPLSFALWAITRLWKKENWVRFFGLLGLITLPLGFDLPITRWFLNLPLPIISSFLPSRIFFINSFCFSILAAFGFSLLKKNKKRNLIIILGLFFFSLLLAGSYVRSSGIKAGEAKVMLRNLILPFATLLSFTLLIIISKFLRKEWFLSGVFLLSLFPQFYLANKYLYFDEKQFVFPPHSVFQFLKEKAGLNRFWSWGKSHILPNFATYYQIYSPEGLDAMYPIWYAELVEAVDKGGQIKETVPRIEPLITQAGDVNLDWQNPFRLRFLSLLGVKYIVGLQNEKTLPPEDTFTKVWEGQNWAAWEYQNALPRAFLVYDYLVETNKQKIVDYLFDEDFDLAKTIVLEKDPQTTIQPCSHSTIGGGDLEITNYSPNRIEIAVNSPCDSLLFLSDNYYPGWQAIIDGQPTEILRADYSFRAVPVPAGQHQIIFSYFPNSFKKGLAVSLLALGGLIIWLKTSKMKKEK